MSRLIIPSIASLALLGSVSVAAGRVTSMGLGAVEWGAGAVVQCMRPGAGVGGCGLGRAVVAMPIKLHAKHRRAHTNNAADRWSGRCITANALAMQSRGGARQITNARSVI